jgi:hypothetical protein
VEPKKIGLPYNVKEMTHKKGFFYLKALSVSRGINFSKTTENKTVQMTEIKNVKVDKCSPYTFAFKTFHSQENYKNVLVNNRRKTKSVDTQLVQQPGYSKKLPTGDKRKLICSTYLEKNHIPKFYATFYESIFK